MQKDKTKKRVYCRQCAKENKRSEYCFDCSRPWNNPSSHIDCGNKNCNMDGDAELLLSAPVKMIGRVECPSYRLCPKCTTRIEHKENCKHIRCPTCKTEFCFICLSLKQHGSWPQACGSWSSPCTPAPVQVPAPTQLPVPDNSGAPPNSYCIVL